MITLDVPNLDATLDPEEMAEFARHLACLSNYANWKSLAMRARLDGRIQRALRYESQCDEVYEKLPQEWRW